MDNGGVYVREKGQLRRLSDIVLSQPAAAAAAAAASVSCRRTKPFVLRKQRFVFTYTAEGSLRYSTKSLFDITLLFVADNLQHVDSLRGFPDQVGERLFAAAEHNGVFSNADVSPKALRLFSDAYGDVVLRSLCLRSRFPLLHERMDEIKAFHSLKCLDLFGCRLGDDHEMFQHLTSTSLANSLTHLSIGGNCLSDAGVQRLTAPVRIMGKGLSCLRLLDVSHNPISERALRYLTCLPKLEQLDVTGTRLKLGAGLATTMRSLLGLVCSGKPLDAFDHSRCRTEGWAEQVVNQWETNGSQTPKQKKVEASRTSAMRFFGRLRFVREVLEASPVAGDGGRPEAESERLHFHKPTDDQRSSDNKGPAGKTQHAESWSGRKRKRGSEENDRTHPGASTSALSAEDVELLNSY